MADGAGLENQWTAMSRGFESHGLRSEVADNSWSSELTSGILK